MLGEHKTAFRRKGHNYIVFIYTELHFNYIQFYYPIWYSDPEFCSYVEWTMLVQSRLIFISFNTNLL